MLWYSIYKWMKNWCNCEFAMMRTGTLSVNEHKLKPPNAIGLWSCSMIQVNVVVFNEQGMNIKCNCRNGIFYQGIYWLDGEFIHIIYGSLSSWLCWLYFSEYTRVGDNIVIVKYISKSATLAMCMVSAV